MKQTKKFCGQSINRREAGGAAMEYIVISTCAAILAISAAAFTMHSFKERMSQMAEKVGIESNVDDFLPNAAW